MAFAWYGPLQSDPNVMGVNVFVVIAIVVLLFIFSKQISAFISSRQSTSTTKTAAASESFNPLQYANAGPDIRFAARTDQNALKRESMMPKKSSELTEADLRRLAGRG
jgi:hypothetical protein